MYHLVFQNDYYKQYYFLRTPYMYEIHHIYKKIPSGRCRVTIYDDDELEDRLKKIDHRNYLLANGYQYDDRVFKEFFKK